MDLPETIFYHLVLLYMNVVCIFYLSRFRFLQGTICDHVILEDNVMSSAVDIGLHVHIGMNSVIRVVM
ncbi:hypothetical protein SNEBB_011367 [Seison nebaliae]|nr:hypothetical protein SNEBB_011367 [Seison nebaliae]